MKEAEGVRLLVLDVDGVLTDGRLYYGNAGEELKAFSTRDGLGIKMLMSAGVEVAIITARESAIVTRRATELGIGHVFQGSRDKLATLSKLMDTLNLSSRELAYMGDDLPDLAAMRRVGLPLTVADAAPQVVAVAKWRSRFDGGFGAVREACEMLLEAQGKLASALRKYTEESEPG